MVSATPVHGWGDYPRPTNLPPVVIRDPALPLVSVVTPSFNQGRFVRDTIESVLSQDYPNIEHWVIDAGSTDETIGILQQYEHDARFHWISERDQGQSDAINKGWRRCRGEIVAWLNSDDTYLTGAIRRQVQALLAAPNCGAVYGDTLYTRQNGEPVYTAYGRPFQMRELLRLTIPTQPTMFLRRSIVEQAGPLDLTFRYSMDSEYWTRAARLMPFMYNPYLVATYRLHEQSKTVAQPERFYEEWLKILDRFFADEQMSLQYEDQRGSLYSDICCTIAASETRRGSLRKALKYIGLSMANRQIRRRLLTVAPALVERYTSIDITPLIAQWWTRGRSMDGARQRSDRDPPTGLFFAEPVRPA